MLSCCIRVIAARSAGSCALSASIAFSARLRSEMSRAIFKAPMIRPFASFTGEIVSEMSSRVPSLRRRIVSKWSTRSPRLRRSSISGSSGCRSDGIMRLAIELPIASAAV